ncbi:hypothetical protein GCM10009087_26750 [Sphingomonas oligophenolica]|uniref:Uncharacterized protein n=1 Tax=Sphingomonas oligophenolica TaxID=301154 RepID=A0ABU9YBX3_9SPHN
MLTSFDAILRCERRLQQLHEASKQATIDRREGWQRELVRVRRELSVAIGELTTAMQEWSPPESAQADFTAFRSHISALRSTLALHQASFPASSVIVDERAYFESTNLIRDRFRELAQKRDALQRVVSQSRSNGV